MSDTTLVDVALTTLVVEVTGMAPVPKGSMGARIVGKRAIPFYTNATDLTRWTREVVWATERAMRLARWQMLTGAVRVDYEFFFHKPKNPKDPVWPSVKPDKDKCERAANDAIVAAGAIKDDSLIVAGGSVKLYAQPGSPVGARIKIRAALER